MAKSTQNSKRKQYVQIIGLLMFGEVKSNQLLAEKTKLGNNLHVGNLNHLP